MPRFSANLGFLWPELRLLDRIDAAAAAGFRAIELHWPYDIPAKAVRERCRLHGLTLLGLNTARGDAAAGEFGLGAVPGRETDFQESADQAITYAVAAGAGMIHCMAGIVPDDDHRRARGTFLANLRAVSAKASAHGLTLLLEPINPHDVPGYFHATAAEAASIIAEAGCTNIALLFDCYHVGRAEGDVLGPLGRFRSMIGHVQIAAVPDRSEPDAGTLDYRAIFSALDRFGYDGWTGCEYKPRAGTDAGLGWVETLGMAL